MENVLIEGRKSCSCVRVMVVDDSYRTCTKRNSQQGEGSESKHGVAGMS